MGTPPVDLGAVSAVVQTKVIVCREAGRYVCCRPGRTEAKIDNKPGLERVRLDAEPQLEVGVLSWDKTPLATVDCAGDLRIDGL